MTLCKEMRTLVQRELLPVVPSSVGRLISVFYNNDLSILEIAGEIERYPAIAGRLLAAANSVWSSPGVPVTQLPDACVRLGLESVRTLSIALAVSNVFNPSKCPAFDVKRYWMSAMLTAQAAGLFAKALEYPGQASTWRAVGLLHNLGLLWLADNKPEQTSAALIRGQSGSVVDAMRDEIGVDYLQAGVCLAGSWRLPQIFPSVIGNFKHPEAAGEYVLSAWVVGVSTMMASALYNKRDWVEIASLKRQRSASFETELSVFNELVSAEKALAEIIDSLTLY